MKLIVINGAKNSKKNLLAMRLAKNSDCVWIHPYTDRRVRTNSEEDMYVRLNKEKLSDKMEREVPLAVTEVNGNRYVFFENQLNAEFVVLIGDDRVIQHLKNNWDGHLITIKCHSEGEEHSSRCLLEDKEFNFVYNYDKDDFDTLIALVEDIHDYEVK